MSLQYSVNTKNITYGTINTSVAPILAEITLNITNSGSGSYTINGSANSTLSFIRGYRYILNINATGHPFWIQTVSGGYSSINIYNTGVTNNGTENGTIIFEVPYDAPTNLYYVCQYHSSMAGSIIVSNSGGTFSLTPNITNITINPTTGVISFNSPVNVNTYNLTIEHTDETTTLSTSYTLTVTPLSITATGNNKIYDRTTAATVTLVGTISGDVVNAPTGSIFNNEIVGNGKTITISGSISGTNSGNYILTSTTATANITAKDITATGNNKIYDRTTAATITLVGTISGDVVNPPISSTFADKIVGNGKTITISGSISGDNSGNYRLTSTTATANITAKDITATGNNKIYDITTAAAVTLVGTISGDVVNPPISSTFADKTVADNKTITISGSITGADSANYRLTSTTATANITLYGLTVNTTNKVYDANTNANVTITSSLLSNEIVTITSANFINKNVGNSKTINIILSNPNYVVLGTPVASITKLSIIAIGDDKIYDAIEIATVTLSGIISGDNVTIPNARFSDKVADTNKSITITGSIGGTDSGNYQLITTVTTANISKLSINAIGNNKVYDGTTNATVILDGILANDFVVPPSATFNNKLVATNKNITITGTISGIDSRNYILSNTQTSASVTKLSITAIGNNKVYDRTTNATVTLPGIILGDTVTTPNANFADKIAANNKIVTIGLVEGTDSGNYILTSNITTANITKLSITANGISKFYDGADTANITLSGVISGDNVTEPTCKFADKVVANNKSITITGSIGGTDGGNYQLITTVTTANISKLSINAIGNDKIYDGTTNATVILDGILANDFVVAPSATFNNKSVATNKNVTVTGTISGIDSRNYILSNTETSASITKLNITAVSNNKVYDGTNNATVTLSGMIPGDNIVIPTASFADKIVAINKIVTISGLIGGSDSGNYTLINTTTANITKLSITATGISKFYDGVDTANITLSGVLSGDNVIEPTCKFADKVVANNKSITITGSIGGIDGGNYQLITTVITANISKLSINVIGNDKVYDGTTNAAVTLDGIVANDFVVAPSATFNNKLVATNKIVTVTGTISGIDSRNYILSNTQTSASITKLNITATGNNKVYNGNTDTTITLTGIVLGDNVTAPTASFADKRAAINKIVTISGTIGGNDSENYSLINNTTTANISKLSITANGTSKIYDSTTDTIITLVGVLSGDNVSAPTASFIDKVVGNNKSITITGLVTGSDSENYIITSVTSASISQLNITFSVDDKAYDGNTTATILLNGILNNDTVTPPNGIFNNKLVGGNKTVTITGSLTGLDRNNYKLINTTSTANILQLDITCTANNKTYDGTVQCTTTLVGILAGDVVYPPTAIFNDILVGTNKNVTITGSISGRNMTNYNLITINELANISSLNITCVGNNKIYDGTDTASVKLLGIILGDIVTPPTAIFSDKNVGNNKVITIDGTIDGSSSSNYNLITTGITGNITKLNITCVGNDKVYDRTQNALVTIVGNIEGDDVIEPTAIFYSRNVANNIRVTITGSISGQDSINYNLTTRITYASITKLDIICIGNNKIYNRNNIAITTLVGTISGDIITAPTSIFDSVFVDINKTVTVIGIIGGINSQNYNLTTTTTTADILPLGITCRGTNKIYDGTNNASTTLIGVLAGDNVLPPNGTFNDKNIGNNKIIDITGTISGDNSGNYTLSNITTNASITQLNIKIIGNDKIYDGTTSAIVTIIGVIETDNVISPIANFSNKKVGINKTITISGNITGNDGNNYKLTNTTTTGNIIQLDIIATGNDKIYDGTTSSTITLNGIINGDSIIAPSSSFVDKIVGNSKTININGIIRGIDSYNYNLINTTTTANITCLNITATGNNKIYDSTRSTTVNLIGIVNGDNVLPPTAIFIDKNIGNNKTVNITGFISGIDNNNYILTSITCTSSITPLNITCTGNNKIYDGTITATVTLSGIISGDIVILPICNFNNKNVENNKVITISQQLNGIDGINYNLITTNIYGNITKLNITCNGNDKIYDSIKTASVTLIGVVNNDRLIAPFGIFDTKNVGNNKIITVNGNISGNDSNNYNLTTTITTANILPLDITLSAADKIYDGTLNAQIILSNILPGDDVISPIGTFDSKIVGNNKIIIISGSLSGNSSANYNLTSRITTTTARILPLEIVCKANNKLYDGNNIATIELIGVIGNDYVLPPSATFNTSTLGNNKLVTITGQISGNDSINYILITTTIFASIYKAILNLIFNIPNKQYDGTTNALLHLESINGILNSDIIRLNSYTANYDNITIGTSKTVNVTNIILAGEFIDQYIYSTTQTIIGAKIYLSTDSLFINNPLYITQNTNIAYLPSTNYNYDYAITINLANLPGVNGDITHIFKSSLFTQNTLNIETYNTNMNILPSNNLNNFIFNWTDINQQMLMKIRPGNSIVGFGTFPIENNKMGDRILEILAHKLFGNAQSNDAIDNSSEFYTHDYKIWDHLSESISNNQTQNDIMNQYISLGRISNSNSNFNFDGLSFDYLLQIDGSLLLNNSIPSNKASIFNNGPDLGGTRLVNGQYEIPILMKFVA